MEGLCVKRTALEELEVGWRFVLEESNAKQVSKNGVSKNGVSENGVSENGYTFSSCFYEEGNILNCNGSLSVTGRSFSIAFIELAKEFEGEKVPLSSWPVLIVEFDFGKKPNAGEIMSEVRTAMEIEKTLGVSVKDEDGDRLNRLFKNFNMVFPLINWMISSDKDDYSNKNDYCCIATLDEPDNIGFGLLHYDKRLAFIIGASLAELAKRERLLVEATLVGLWKYVFCKEDRKKVSMEDKEVSLFICVCQVAVKLRGLQEFKVDANLRLVIIKD